MVEICQLCETDIKHCACCTKCNLLEDCSCKRCDDCDNFEEDCICECCDYCDEKINDCDCVWCDECGCNIDFRSCECDEEEEEE